jgi:hypothetical protein
MTPRPVMTFRMEDGLAYNLLHCPSLEEMQRSLTEQTPVCTVVYPATSCSCGLFAIRWVPGSSVSTTA